MVTDISSVRAAASRVKSGVALAKLDARGLVICKKNGNLGARVAKWRVTLGKKITAGAKVRATFDTEKEAKDFIDGWLKEKKKYADASLPPDVRAETVRCLSLLESFSATLTDAVEFFIKHATPPGGKKLAFGEVVDLFLKDRQDHGGKMTTLNTLRSRLKQAARVWGDRPMSEIGTGDIKAWLAKRDDAPKTRNNFIGDLSNLFNFAMQEKYCGLNPAADIKSSKVVRDEAGILTPAQARNLLLASMTECPELTDGIAIALFAGLRRSELCQLDWKYIHLPEREIVVGAKVTKGDKRRVVTINDTLFAWLNRNPQPSGPVVFHVGRFNSERHPISVDTFGEKLKSLVDAKTGPDARPALVSSWPHNAMRHSFCSYFFAHTKNINRTAAEAGHNPRMTEQHYKGLVRDADAKAYWAILPEADEVGKVVEFAAV